jgi:hypothetical protein
MNATSQDLVSKIERMSNFEVSESIEKVFRRERHLQADFILLLNEISTRRLHVQMGYSSLMVYCVKHFHLTEFSAYKRMQIARASRTFPSLIDAIRTKKLSLTTAAMIAPKLKQERSEEQIQKCSGKSKEEVKKIIAGWEPKPDVKESIRHIHHRGEQAACTTSPFPAPGTNSSASLCNFSAFFSEGEKSDSESRTKEEVKPLSAERTCLRFSINPKTEEKLKRAQELLGSNRLEDLFDVALEALLERKDPVRRQARREKKAAVKPKPTEQMPVVTNDSPKTITPKIKDKVLKQASHQCTYVSSDGQRCDEKRWLELEHIIPRGKGGDNSERNLTILCKAHNLYLAELHFGKEKVRTFCEVRSSG